MDNIYFPQNVYKWCFRVIFLYNALPHFLVFRQVRNNH